MPPSGMIPMIPPGMMRRPQPRPSGMPAGGLTNPGAGPGQLGGFGTPRPGAAPGGTYPGGVGGGTAQGPGMPNFPFGHFPFRPGGHFGPHPMGGGPGGRSILDAILGAGAAPGGFPADRPVSPALGGMLSGGLGGLTRQPHATMDPGAMGGMLHAFGGGQPMAPARPPLALTNQAPRPAAPAVRRYPAGMTVNGRSSY